MKGQSSIETLIAVIILFLFLTMITIMNIGKNNQVKLLEKRIISENECEKVSMIVSEMFLQQRRTEMVFHLKKDANINNRELFIGNYSCLLLANVQDVNLNTGEIKIKKITDEVTLENV